MGKIENYIIETQIPLAYYEGKNFTWENRELLIKNESEFERKSEKHKEMVVKKGSELGMEVVGSFLKNYEEDSRKLYQEMYLVPQKEPKSKILFVIDRFSMQMRYHLFITGMVVFLMSTIIRILT